MIHEKSCRMKEKRISHLMHKFVITMRKKVVKIVQILYYSTFDERRTFYNQLI